MAQANVWEILDLGPHSQHPNSITAGGRRLDAGDWILPASPNLSTARTTRGDTLKRWAIST
jgi:hypothetical protein